jgi:hypothetical protein
MDITQLQLMYVTTHYQMVLILHELWCASLAHLQL